jgi:hypothetical protein
MNKKQLGLAVAGVLFSISGALWAGEVATSNVVIGANYSRGSVVTARNSGDANQRIMCTSYGYDDDTEWGACTSKNSAGTTSSCYSSVHTIIESMRAVGPSSHIAYGFNSDGDCTYVTVNNSSAHSRY